MINNDVLDRCSPNTFEQYSSIKIKYLFDLGLGSTPKSEDPSNWDGDIVWISPSDFKTANKYIYQGKRNLSKKGYDSCSTKIVEKGSIIITKRAPVGTVGIAAISLCPGTGCISCLPKSYTNSLYYYYVFSAYTEEFLSYAAGTTFMEISLPKFGNIKVPYSPITQQNKIADFLDSKTDQINLMIDNLNKQIESLKDYKKEIISETVTKGLDPNVPLKDSGIDWIGKVPVDWKIEKIKFHSKTRNEKEKNEQSTYDYIALENIESFTGNYIETDSKYDKEGTQLVYSGDVLFGKLRPYLAKVFLCECNLNASNEFVAFNPTNLSSRYLKYYLLNESLIDYVNSTTNGTKMPRTNSDVLKNLPIPVMALTEQELIGKHLDLLCSRVDKLISIDREIIDKLNEYSKSLIYEYVTGKKEVI